MQTMARAAILRQKMQIKLAVSPRYSILALCRPVLALTLERQMPDREVTRAAFLNTFLKK